MKCVFCNSPILICQIEASKVCENPICYSCLQIYWKLNKYHCVNIHFMPDEVMKEIRHRFSKTKEADG